MQVTADTLALCGSGESAHFVMRQAKGSILLLVHMLDCRDGADDQGSGWNDHQQRSRIADPPSQRDEYGIHQQQLHHVQAEGRVAETQHHATVDEVAQAAPVPGQQPHAQCSHAQRIELHRASRRQLHLGEQQQEHRQGAQREQQPAARVAGDSMVKQRCDKNPHQPQQMHAVGPRRLAVPDVIGNTGIRRRRKPSGNEVRNHGAAFRWWIDGYSMPLQPCRRRRRVARSRNTAANPKSTNTCGNNAPCRMPTAANAS